MNKKYHLATSSSIIKNKIFDNLLFLGYWCISSKQSLIDKKKYNFNIAEPFGIKENEKISNKNKILMYEKLIFPKIVYALNGYHKINESERFWRILIGNWF